MCTAGRGAWQQGLCRVHEAVWHGCKGPDVLRFRQHLCEGRSPIPALLSFPTLCPTPHLLLPAPAALPARSTCSRWEPCSCSWPSCCASRSTPCLPSEAAGGWAGRVGGMVSLAARPCSPHACWGMCHYPWSSVHYHLQPITNDVHSLTLPPCPHLPSTQAGGPLPLHPPLCRPARLWAPDAPGGQHRAAPGEAGQGRGARRQTTGVADATALLCCGSRAARAGAASRLPAHGSTAPCCHGMLAWHCAACCTAMQLAAAGPVCLPLHPPRPTLRLPP